MFTIYQLVQDFAPIHSRNDPRWYKCAVMARSSKDADLIWSVLGDIIYKSICARTSCGVGDIYEGEGTIMPILRLDSPHIPSIKSAKCQRDGHKGLVPPLRVDGGSIAAKQPSFGVTCVMILRVPDFTDGSKVVKTLEPKNSMVPNYWNLLSPDWMDPDGSPQKDHGLQQPLELATYRMVPPSDKLVYNPH